MKDKGPMLLNIPGYKAETASFSTAELGALTVLIGKFWVGGPLPNDDAELAPLACCTPAQWQSLKGTVLGKFVAIEEGRRLTPSPKLAALIKGERY